jgi:hypothetical protein
MSRTIKKLKINNIKNMKIIKKILPVFLFAGVLILMGGAMVDAASDDGTCNVGDATITTPASATAVGGTAVTVSWTFDAGNDCNIDDPHVFDIETSHDGGASWVKVATSAEATSTSVTFNSTAGQTPDDSDYRFRLNAGGAIVDTTAYSDVIIDNTDPVILSAETVDSQPNGVIDKIKVTFTEAIGMDQANISTTGWYVTQNDGENAYSIEDITWIDETSMYLNLTEEATHITSVTPQVGYDGSGTTSDLAGNEVTTTSVANATDGAAPYVVITAPLTTERVTSTDTVTFTSTELTNAQCSIDNTNWDACTSSTYAFSDNAEYVALDEDATFTLYVKDTDGASNVGTDSEVDLVKDTTAPDVDSIDLDDTALKIGDTTTVTITFTEAVTGFTNDDITTIDSGTLTDVSSSDGGITWTSTFTPTVGVEAATNVITITETGLTDLAGNAGEGTTSSANYEVDTLAPTAPTAVTFTATGGTVETDYVNTTNTNFTGGATITANQAVGGTAEWYIGGAAFSTPISDIEILTDATTVTFDASLDNNVAVQAQIASGPQELSVNLCDAAGNCTESSAGNKTITADYVIPTITDTAPATDTSIKTQQVSYTLSEAAEATSGVIVFTNTGGAADGSSPHTCVLQGTALYSETHTDLTLQTDGNACVAWANPLIDGAIYTVTFDSSDTAGNPATTVTNTGVTYDTTAPTIPVGNIVGTTISGAGDTIVITFDEPVVADDGTWSTNEFTSITGSISGALTLTNADFSYSGIELTITLDEATDEAYLKNTETITVDPVADAIKDVAGTSLADAAVVGTTAVTGDTTGPTVALTYSPDQTVYKAGDSVTITATFNEAMEESDILTIAIETIGDGDLVATNMTKTSNMVWTYDWTVPSGVDEDGAATMTIAATDYAGNANQAATNNTKTIDNTVPAGYTVSIDQSYINSSNEDAFSFTFADAEVDATYDYSIDDTDGETAAVTGTGTITGATDQITGINVSTLNDDTLTITVTLTDPAGNEGDPATDSITKDTINPVSAVTIADDLYGTTTFVTDTINGTASDAGTGVASVTITIQESGTNNYWDGDSWEVEATDLPVDGTTTWTYNSATAITHTDERTYTVTPTATDTAGNAFAGTADTYTWDGSIPTISNYNSDKANGSYKAGVVIDVDVTFSEAVTTASPITLTMDTGGTCVIDSIDNSATATCDYTVEAGDTSADLTVSSFSAAGAVVDQAGNIMTSFTPTGNNLAANKALIIDTTAPVVNAGTDAGTVAETFTQNATVTDTNMAGIVYAWTKQSGPYTITFGTDNAEDTTITAGGVGNYTVRLTATDLAGNSAYDETSLTWNSLNVPIASYNPANGATNVAIADGTATITFGGSSNITLLDDTKVTLVNNDGTETSVKGTVAVSGGDGTSQILNIPYTGLENDHTYRINIYSGAIKDATGHINSDGVSYFTTVSATGDVTPPVISLTSVTSTQTTATVVFESTETGTTHIKYGLNSSYGNTTDEDATITVDTPKTITLGGLTCGTTYHYKIYAEDASGNISSNLGDATFDTSACTETVTPTVTLIGDAIVSSYTQTEATTRFDSGLVFDTTDAVSAIVNGVDTAIDESDQITITASTELGAHSYDVVVTSSTGHTATTQVTYQVTTDQGEVTTPFVDVPVAKVQKETFEFGSWGNGHEWRMLVTLPDAHNSFALKFDEWVSGDDTVGAAGNMRYYSEQIDSGTGSEDTPVSIATNWTYPDHITIDPADDVDLNRAGIQTYVRVLWNVPASTPTGNYSSKFKVITSSIAD